MNLLESTSRDDADLYFLEFELPDLRPGRYRLEILAEDAGTGSVVRTAASFSVRLPHSDGDGRSGCRTTE
jgi:hypothetical protein